MRDRGLSEALIRSSNSALRKFWKFHTEEGNIRSVTQLLLRPSRIPKSRKAVLPKTLSSEEVLQFLKSQTDQDIKLLTLFGYFATLRPQETLALTRQDLKVDESLECCKVMREHGLYGKLAVRVDKQKSKSGEIKAPKAGSVGWVAIFDERAARMIAELVRPMAGALISIGADCAGKKFRKAGLGVTLKDLRRAGLYWLAHYGGLTYAALKNHARHSDPSTTWVYLRRPDEGEAVNDDLRL
jgi:integrase